MTITILDAAFAKAADLAALLSARRLNVALVRSPALINTTSDLLILSAKSEADLGGAASVAELARKHNARAIMVIEEGAMTFDVSHDLGGRRLRIALPVAHSHGALLMTAHLAAAPLSKMVAGDAQTATLMAMAARVAGFDVSVFINGPTGSGKEVLSQFIHANSPRKDKPFVALNCAAIPENMLEALLFGHEKGAFTGAATANKGLLRAADGGTLMLDEISEMAIGLQAKLLRVLQERRVTPLGSQKEEAVDIRIIATSNRDMEQSVAEGTFREDLYYRLNVFPLETQALKDRAGDIAPLATALLQRHASHMPTPPILSTAAIEILEAHSWAGNVRELENVMQRALVLQQEGVIAPEHIMLRASAAAWMPPAIAA